MRRALAGLAVLAIAASGCAADPPSAVVGVSVTGCAPQSEHGSGMFVEVDGQEKPLVLTSAHVVAGAREIIVTRGDAATAGRIVAFDPDMDLAVIEVDGFGAAHPWKVDSSRVDEGATGAAYVVRDGRTVSLPITVRRRVRIRTEDVYLEGETLRPGYELGAVIEAGDSGGAVVVDGRVIGVLWARSRRADDRAYAIDPVRAGDLIRAQLRTGDLSGVDPSRCP